MDADPKPKPKEDEGGVGCGRFEYGYASRSFLADCWRAWRAVSRDGRGMSESTWDLSEGCEDISEVRIGKSDCEGKLADLRHS